MWHFKLQYDKLPFHFFHVHERGFQILSDKCVVIYLNKIVFYSHTKKDYWKNLKSIMNILKRNQHFANPGKFQFMTQEVVLPGHVVSKDGIKPKSKKSKAVSKMLTPQD